MGGCTCTVLDCGVNSNTPGIHFFHFPVFDNLRCLQWMFNCNRLDYLTLLVSQVKNKVVCEAHFEQKMFMNSLHNKLKHCAIPTLHHCKNTGIPVYIIKVIEDCQKKNLSLDVKRSLMDIPYVNYLTLEGDAGSINILPVRYALEDLARKNLDKKKGGVSVQKSFSQKSVKEGGVSILKADLQTQAILTKIEPETLPVEYVAAKQDHTKSQEINMEQAIIKPVERNNEPQPAKSKCFKPNKVQILSNINNPNLSVKFKSPLQHVSPNALITKSVTRENLVRKLEQGKLITTPILQSHPPMLSQLADTTTPDPQLVNTQEVHAFVENNCTVTSESAGNTSNQLPKPLILNNSSNGHTSKVPPKTQNLNANSFTGNMVDREAMKQLMHEVLEESSLAIQIADLNYEIDSIRSELQKTHAKPQVKKKSQGTTTASNKSSNVHKKYLFNELKQFVSSETADRLYSELFLQEKVKPAKRRRK